LFRAKFAANQADLANWLLAEEKRSSHDFYWKLVTVPPVVQRYWDLDETAGWFITTSLSNRRATATCDGRVT